MNFEIMWRSPKHPFQ